MIATISNSGAKKTQNSSESTTSDAEHYPSGKWQKYYLLRRNTVAWVDSADIKSVQQIGATQDGQAVFALTYNDDSAEEVLLTQ